MIVLYYCYMSNKPVKTLIAYVVQMYSYPNVIT